jgi:tetratricopeptide (TPR) repeat protein
MQPETNNWQAFNLATDALRDIDRFVSSSSKNRTVLVGAREKLRDAVGKDPQFSRAQYYSAIVDDMLGHSANAVSQLESLIASEPDFKIEAQYNLGVSYYHLYSRDKIDRAIAEFEFVERQTSNAALKYMAQAGLIRSFAMMVLHSNRAGDHGAAERFFRQATSTSGELLKALKSDSSLKPKTQHEVRWRALNGQGVGRMFYSDNQTDLGARKTTLDLAQSDFEAADKLSTNNWEIVCNLGSVHMRLAVVAKQSGKPETATAEFTKAHSYLKDVVDRIRPNYGFALWELGRVCRLAGDFATAIVWFEKALQVPEDERNISDKGVRVEIEKADQRSDIFS